MAISGQTIKVDGDQRDRVEESSHTHKKDGNRTGNASNVDGGQPMEKGRLEHWKKLLSNAIPETSLQADAPVFTMPVKSRESTSTLFSTYNNEGI